jgi:Zn-dependent protease/CBS domain-containing protein
MFRNAITLPFKLFGIPVRLDMSFLLILPILAWLIASQVPAYAVLLRRLGVMLQPGDLQTGVVPYLLGLFAALGLFMSVLIHEIGHALTAKLYGVHTKEITLWFLGGVAQFDELPRQRGAEAVVAIAGPLTSLLIAAMTFWLFRQVSASGLLFVLTYLTITNVALAVFNMLPALPLDGGRVLRSLLALRFDYQTATKYSVNISQIIAILLGIYGLLNFQIFTVAIAFFIFNAGQAEAQYARVTHLLDDLTVADIMTTDVITVEPETPLAQFKQLIFYRRHVGYPVVDAAGRLMGFARMQDAQDNPDDQTVAHIMVPAETITADSDAIEALKRMAQSRTGRFVVLDRQGGIVGLISKTDLLRIIREDR